jgi:uncharacterized protein (DUF1697 family)
MAARTIGYVALLRGVNVGGHNLVSMADLCRVVDEAGMSGARSLLQSGNLVFRGGAKAGAAVERLLEAAVAKRLDLRTDLHVRTAAEWAAIVAANPFVDEAEREPSRTFLFAFKEPLDGAKVKALRAAIPGRERIEAAGRELFAVYPDGMGRSKLTTALIDRTLGARGTARNWNTVLKLAAAIGD